MDKGIDLEKIIERHKVEEYYGRINSMWKAIGMAALTHEYGVVPGRFYVSNHLQPGLIQETCSRITLFDNKGRGGDWISEWCKSGERNEEYAEEALRQGKRIAAGEFYLVAYNCYHVSHYFYFADFPMWEVKKKAMKRYYTAFGKAAPLLVPPAERIDIPFEGVTLPAYLIKPLGVERPPVVVFLGGANHVKEECLVEFSELYLKRGMACLGFDGPGQGEFIVETGIPLRTDMSDRAFTAVVDYLHTRKDINYDKIALHGTSTGGYLVVHAAASEQRPKAVVSHCTIYSWDPYWLGTWGTSLNVQLEVAFLLGAKTFAELAQLVRSEVNLEPVVDKIRTPLLLVHGKHDTFVPATDALKLKERAKCPVELSIWEDGGTHCFNIHYRVAIHEAEWLREKLA